MVRLAALAALVLFLAAGVASGATPKQYTARMNAICRSYTPQLHREEKNLTIAGLRRLATLAVKEDTELLAQPVPTRLRTPMAPLLAQLRLYDREAHRARNAARAGNRKLTFRYLDRMLSAESVLDRRFNAEGLRACGSEQ